LLADSAHGGADVLSYGLNFFIEWLKLRAARQEEKQEDSANIIKNAAKIVDTWGSVASLVTLVIAATFAATEAVERLSTPSGKDSKNIGPALLVFAIVSTSANMYLVVMYKRWHTKGSRTSEASQSESIAESQPAVVENLEAPDQMLCLPCMPCPSPMPSQNAEDQTSDHVAQPPEHPANTEGMGGGMMTTLHMALHPGCACSNHAGAAVEDSMQENPSTPETPSVIKAQNLNLIAAMLHLVTDVLRGILVLFVALLILMGGVEDAERTDALCALVVAFLIFAGSIALTVKVVSRLYGFCRRRGYSLQDDGPQSSCNV